MLLCGSYHLCQIGSRPIDCTQVCDCLHFHAFSTKSNKSIAFEKLFVPQTKNMHHTAIKFQTSKRKFCDLYKHQIIV